MLNGLSLKPKKALYIVGDYSTGMLTCGSEAPQGPYRIAVPGDCRYSAAAGDGPFSPGALTTPFTGLIRMWALRPSSRGMPSALPYVVRSAANLIKSFFPRSAWAI